MVFTLLQKKRLYCQMCGNEIDAGGYVCDGKLYCNINSRCLISAFEKNHPAKFEYETRKEILGEIKTGAITHYGKLEKNII